MLTLSEQEKNALLFFRMYPTLKEKFLLSDSRRFAALDEESLIAFIRKAHDYAVHRDLHYLDEIFHVGCIMALLGSEFSRDPRYRSIDQLLSDRTRTARVEASKKLLMQYATTLWGADHTQTCKRAQMVLADIQHVHTPEKAVYMTWHDRSGVAVKSWLPEAADQQIYAKAVEASAKRLGLMSPNAHNCVFWISWWLGLHFEDNPSFPWVRACYHKANGDEGMLLEKLVTFMSRQLNEKLKVKA